VKLTAAVLRNHRSNDLGVWYDDISMYLVVHKELKFCNRGFAIESLGRGSFFLQEKILFWSDSNETSQGCVDVHLGFDIFKMTAVTMVTMKV
jgi:hypothetical protein